MFVWLLPPELSFNSGVFYFGPLQFLFISKWMAYIGYLTSQRLIDPYVSLQNKLYKKGLLSLANTKYTYI